MPLVEATQLPKAVQILAQFAFYQISNLLIGKMENHKIENELGLSCAKVSTSRLGWLPLAWIYPLAGPVY